MSKFYLVYAAVIFIMAVLLFTYSELKKDSDQEEPETYHWMKVFSVLLLIMAIASFVASRMTPA